MPVGPPNEHSEGLVRLAIVVGSGAVLLMTVVGCDSPQLMAPEFSDGNHPAVTDDAKAATVSVTLAATSIFVGQTAQASAVARDAAGNELRGRPIAWSASVPTVVSVSANGVVNALNSGNAEIVATVDGVIGHRTITVGTATNIPPSPAASAELPREYVNTSMPSAAGNTITVPANGDLQAALNAAQPGDVIRLAAGATYVGNFVLPKKAATGWIIIRPAIPDAALPAEGQRMTPARASSAQLPRILSPNWSPALATTAGANHYRIIGLEIGLAGAPSLNYGLVMLGQSGSNGQATTESVPHHLVLDRVYIHGNSSTNVQRCVALNSTMSAIIDSYLSECHDRSGDAQAVAGWNGPGPYKIANNYLEASGENIMFGGSDPSIVGLVPSDIEIRRNHITRPVSWKGVWKVKNLLEIKNARRVLIEGNVFENNWADGQDGEAILLIGVNQGGTAPWSGVQDITIRLNVIRNVGAGFLVTTYTANGPVQPTERVAIYDNLIYELNTGIFTGTGRTFTVTGDVRDFVADHNTIVAPTNSILALGGGTKVRLACTNNLGAGGNYGISGDGAVGAAAFALHAPGGTFAGNVLAMPIRADEMPAAGNWYPPSIDAVGFQDVGGRDYRLATSSQYVRRAIDGRDPGADVAAVSSATQAVVVQ